MALLPFVKVEGLGNDFLVVDLRPGKPAQALADVATRPAIVRALCDRNFGVGGDGVLAILPGEAGDARMRVLNADGSEAEMCGNGIRCVAKVLYDSDPALRKKPLAHRHRRRSVSRGPRVCAQLTGYAAGFFPERPDAHETPARTPGPSSRLLPTLGPYGALAQLGEHQLCKLGVAGSSPARSITATPGTRRIHEMRGP